MVPRRLRQHSDAGAGADPAGRSRRASARAAAPRPPLAAAAVVELRVPDIGDFKDVAVIEVFVKPGDTIKPSRA